MPNIPYAGGPRADVSWSSIAPNAYSIADAMLAEREKSK